MIFLKLYLKRSIFFRNWNIWFHLIFNNIAAYLDAIIFLKLYLKQHLRQYCWWNNIDLLRILSLKLYLKGPQNSSAVTKVRWRGRRRSAARTCIIFLSLHSQFSRWKFFTHCCTLQHQNFHSNSFSGYVVIDLFKTKLKININRTPGLWVKKGVGKFLLIFCLQFPNFSFLKTGHTCHSFKIKYFAAHLTGCKEQMFDCSCVQAFETHVDEKQK